MVGTPEEPSTTCANTDEVLWCIDTQERELDRLLDWIKAIDSKVPVLMAISTAMVAAIAAVTPDASNLSNCSVLWVGVGVLPAVASLVCCALATFPQTKGPGGSLIFFGTIAEHSVESYAAAVSSRRQQEYLTDLTAQCHRNAQIASSKYRRVRAAAAWLFIAILPWLLAIYVLYKG